MIEVRGKTYKYTFGEALNMSKSICHITKGQYVATLPTHAPRLTREEAIQYYNKKLREYWKTITNKSIKRENNEF